MHKPPVFHPGQLKEALTSRNDAKISQLTEFSHPPDLALFQEQLTESEEVRYFIQALGSERYAKVLSHLSDDLVEETLELLSKKQKKQIFTLLNDDVQANILRTCSMEQHTSLLSSLHAEDKKIVNHLLQYAHNTAGGWMTTKVGRVTTEMTVKQALEQLRSLQESTETLARIYVVDEDGVLKGKLRLRDLAFNTWDTPILNIMKSVDHPILATEDQEVVAMKIKKYDLILAAVVDERNRLLGVVTHDDAMEIAEQESTEDMERIAGLTGEQSESTYLYTSVLTHFKRRFLWLFGLALLAVASGYIMMQYEATLSGLFILSLFLPMVIASGGNTGGQAATMVIRAMALGELTPNHAVTVLWKEFRLGALLGCTLGASLFTLCGIALPLFKVPLPSGITYLGFALSVSLAMGLQVLCSSLIGALLPLGARAIKLDPAVIAAPAITTIVDVIGMVIYFTIAHLILFL